MFTDQRSRVTAVLGPTNTGKTHYAIERMLAHRTGVIGLPLRLLAREVYDRIVGLRGPSVVALITGEERIVPPRAAFWVCTVEAMPIDLNPEFLAVDEIQLCADPDRGHIFTHRLLHARGLSETLFLGSDTMRARIASLIPGAGFLHRDRFSRLTYTGARKISRMPPRSAIVGFSVEDVYAIAELIRRQKGGAAVVMGALSPRTRNAQVALYQNGDVDHLVATDAIGMGLNLDIGHVAFSGVVKFDGRRHRHLAPGELAQIAGRAGRYTADGTFGVTGEAGPLDPEVVEAIETHRFAPLSRLQWRNARLDFGTPEGLIASLEAPADQPDLQRARESDDLATLRALIGMPEMRDRIQGARAWGPQDTRLLWDVCQIPDFRKVSPAEHASLCARLHGFVRGGGGIPTDWLAAQIHRIDRTEGDIDALSRRLAYIRTWTYVAQRKSWVDDADHWRDETRAVEDRLSDALHARLTQRFVDRRTSVLMRWLKQKESLVANVTETGEVSIDDQFIGRLEGFRFRLDPTADAESAKTLRAAGIAALAPALSLRADRFYNAPDPEIDVTEQGGLMWGEHAVGKLVTGADALSPQVQPFVDEDAAPEIGERVRRRLGHWIDRRIAALFQPLIALRDDEALTGMARGIAFRLVEALGVLPRGEIADDVKALDQDQRAGLRKHGVRFGQYTVFQPLLLKPAPTRLRLVLWSLAQRLDVFPEAPPPGLVTLPAVAGAPHGYYPRAGYRLAGDRAIRIDMLERLADMIRGLDARAGFEASPDMLSITGLSLEQFARLMQGMGYQATEGVRPKRRPPAALKTEEAKMQITDENAEAGAASRVRDADAAVDAAAVAGTPGDLPAEPPGGVPPGPPGDIPGDIPGETPPETPGDIPENVPGEPPPRTPGDVPVELPGDAPAEVPGDLPQELPDDRPSEIPGDIPNELPGDLPAELPGDLPPRAPGEMPMRMHGEAAAETEAFFTFARAPRQRPDRAPREARKHIPRAARPVGDASPPGGAAPQPSSDGEVRPRPQGKPRRGPGKAADGKPERRPYPKPDRKPERERGSDRKPVVAEARPPRHEKPIDPDNPFAALLALKTQR